MFSVRVVTRFWAIGAIALMTQCSPAKKETEQKVETPESPKEELTFHPAKGKLEIYDETFGQTINRDASIEVLAEGFVWTEGPVWIPGENYLLFCDIPRNTIYKWKNGEGASVYLTPSGYSGEKVREGEPGSNGLMLNAQGQLLLCQHGDRKVSIMNASLDNPKPDFIGIADNYEGRRFNSPNDLIVHSNNDIYFTDPPYGLEKGMEDPAKELDFQGVYRWSAKDKTTELLYKDLSRPNGIALSPDEKTAYVANSDPKKAIWMAFDIDAMGKFTNSRIFYDATAITNHPGLPDGMAVDTDGNIFATGPGGVWVFSPSGKLLAKIRTGQKTANCTFSDDYKYLYMTAHSYLLRIQLKS